MTKPSLPFKMIQTFTYTEVVYYDANGNEVHRERNYDDSLYDETGSLPLSDTELEDYFPEQENDR